MVKKLCSLLCILLSLYSVSAIGKTELQATVDRNKIYENDTITLLVTGDVEMEFNFGGLLNFGRNQIQAPNTDALAESFSILDRNQSYNMRSINGVTTAQVTWQYVLAPKSTGELSIPALNYDSASTDPIRITVLPGAAPKNEDNPPLAFIEAEVDKSSAYVQEQIVYTLRLYTAAHLANGDLSAPAPENAIVEQIGDTQKYFRMAYNQRYEVRERKYLLFPQLSGQLDIAAQSFDGTLIDPKTRRRLRVREKSEPVSVDIKTPPASFSGEIWLPASSLEFSETWDKEPYGLSVGDSLTRTLEIKARGLLGSALPPITMAETDGLKVYPDQPVTESYEHEQGVESVRQEAAALIAVKPNKVNLPEIRLPWWDTENDVERIAIIPAREFEILPAANGPSNQSQQSIVDLSSSPTTEVVRNDQPISEAQIEAGQVDLAESGLRASPPAVNNNHRWYLIIALLCIGWASTTWFLLNRGTRTTKMVDADITPVDTSSLIKAIKNHSSETPSLLIQWANLIFDCQDRGKPVRTIDDLKSLDEQLYNYATSLENHLYGKGSSSAPDTSAIISHIKRLKRPKQVDSKSNDLQAMYP